MSSEIFPPRDSAIYRALTEILKSRIIDSEVRKKFGDFGPLIREQLFEETKGRVLDAVLSGTLSPGPGFQARLRSYTRTVVGSRDLWGIAKSLQATVGLEASHGINVGMWCPPPSGGNADEDDVDESLELWGRMAPRWQESIHGKAIVLGKGLHLNQPQPIWLPADRKRLAKIMSRDPGFALDDLTNYPNGDEALSHVWSSLEASGRSTLSLPGVRQSSAQEAAHIIAMDQVTPWPRPSQKVLSYFARSIITALPKELTPLVQQAVSMWIAAVFEPTAAHGVRSLTPPAPPPHSNQMRAVFNQLAEYKNRRLGSTPHSVANYFASTACGTPHRLHLSNPES